ncbi:beta-N-acetylhexosaminidase [Tropicimonas sp. IMCC34043]|uniref:beta-N-acetylhexosaminidase n=1 Tax=Tropicimonas sp. IMCC34043 TaxID=2248760 RepID=UPI000E21DC72|nr:beta-N-acetylhexosaminidase [Tropicimonas sp. IMCC34043]
MRAASATILGCAGTALSADERDFFAEAQPWGFILFARNVETPDQIRRLTGDLRAAVGRDAPVLVDQEGGRVQRMRAPHWREWLPPLDQMARTPDPERAARAMFLRYRLIAEELRAVGIDTDCAPMADIARPDTHPFLRNRCFGEDVATVVAGARAAAEGLMAGGVLPVLKHVPGHGLSRLDSHLDLPVIDAPADLLRAEDFAAFAGLADLPMAMTAHLTFTAFDPDRPATQSARMVGLIRDEIGFDGLLMSDDLSMQALRGGPAERAEATIAAGCDLVLHCNGVMAEAAEVVAAAGRLTPSAERRARVALARRGAAQPIDVAAADAELAALLEGDPHG